MTWRIYRKLRKNASVAKAVSKAVQSIAFPWKKTKRASGIRLSMKKTALNAVNV